MLQLIAIPAVLAGLYALGIVARTDLMRLAQGVRHVSGQVVRHDSGPDGFVPVFAFYHGERAVEVRGRTAAASPDPPVGSTRTLSYPARRPDLARQPEVLGRSLLYIGFAAWLAFFTDLLFGWV